MEGRQRLVAIYKILQSSFEDGWSGSERIKLGRGQLIHGNLMGDVAGVMVGSDVPRLIPKCGDATPGDVGAQ